MMVYVYFCTVNLYDDVFVNRLLMYELIVNLVLYRVL